MPDLTLYRYGLHLDQPCQEYADAANLRTLVMSGTRDGERGQLLYTARYPRLDEREPAPDLVTVQAPYPLSLKEWGVNPKVIDLEQKTVSYRIDEGLWDIRAEACAYRRLQSGDRRGRTHPVSGALQLTAWLGRTMEQAGADLDESTVTLTKTMPAVAPHRGIHWRRTWFQARVYVHDAEAFSGKVVNGIGRGKAFGAGLVLIRRGPR